MEDRDLRRDAHQTIVEYSGLDAGGKWALNMLAPGDDFLGDLNTVCRFLGISTRRVLSRAKELLDSKQRIRIPHVRGVDQVFFQAFLDVAAAEKLPFSWENLKRLFLVDPSIPKLGLSPSHAVFGSIFDGPIVPKTGLPQRISFQRSLLGRHLATRDVIKKLTRRQRSKVSELIRRKWRRPNRVRERRPLVVYFLVQHFRPTTTGRGELSPLQRTCERVAGLIEQEGLPNLDSQGHPLIQMRLRESRWFYRPEAGMPQDRTNEKWSRRHIFELYRRGQQSVAEIAGFEKPQPFVNLLLAW